ncbi:Hypothetical predicted protein [Prunus dulcis]|uniref:Secreted protein n=1 Tax=Prunus dulcis TaxID=3755 RepID=A0A5E4FNT3_PRUDU|nr:Hypothetical predicted protein [Prunus dulcis]
MVAKSSSLFVLFVTVLSSSRPPSEPGSCSTSPAISARFVTSTPGVSKFSGCPGVLLPH